MADQQSGSGVRLRRSQNCICTPNLHVSLCNLYMIVASRTHCFLHDYDTCVARAAAGEHCGKAEVHSACGSHQAGGALACNICTLAACS